MFLSRVGETREGGGWRGFGMEREPFGKGDGCEVVCSLGVGPRGIEIDNDDDDDGMRFASDLEGGEEANGDNDDGGARPVSCCSRACSKRRVSRFISPLSLTACMGVNTNDLATISHT